MKSKIISAALLVVSLGQAACITTVHTDPYPRTRTVHVTRSRSIYVPPPRPPQTIVTVRRY